MPKKILLCIFILLYINVLVLVGVGGKIFSLYINVSVRIQSNKKSLFLHLFTNIYICVFVRV